MLYFLCRDGNSGLSKQVLVSLRKKNIQRLTKTFLTLSLADVASRVQLPSPRDAEKAILNMVNANLFQCCLTAIFLVCNLLIWLSLPD